MPTLNYSGNRQQNLARALLVGPGDDWRSGIQVLGFGGAAGGGKTFFNIMIALEYALEFPGCTIGFFRRTEEELERTIVRTAKPMFDGLPGVRYYVGKFQFEIGDGPSPSVIRFCYLDSFADLDRYQSDAFDFIIVDEAALLDPMCIQSITTERWRSALGYPRKLIFTFNPGGPAHIYLKNRLYDPAAPGTIFTEASTGLTCAFVPARATDNPYWEKNDPLYLKQLANHPDKERRRRLWEGDMNVVEGQAFNMWRDDLHVVEPFEIPGSWLRWGSVDFGYNDPLCFLWFAQCPETRVIYVYREFYESQLSDERAKEKITFLSGSEKLLAVYADSSGRAKQSTSGLSTWDYWAREPFPIYLSLANKSRVHGARQIKGLLAPGDDAPPRLKIFSNCRNLISTLPNMQTDPKDPEDVREGGNDHPYDALRYGVLSRVASTTSSQPLLPGLTGKSYRAKLADNNNRRSSKIPVLAGRERYG